MVISLPGRLSFALCAWLSCAALAAAAPPPRIAEADVRAFMTEVEQASQARDVERIGRLMAPDCVVVFADGSGHVAAELTRDAYLERLRAGTTALGDVENYRYELSNVHIALSKDAQAATVDSDVTERLRYNERDIVTRSHEGARVERRGGALLYVRVTGTVTGTSR